MSKQIAVIQGTGRQGVDLQLTQYAGTKEIMIQLTQGFALEIDDPGFIQLTKDDAEELIEQLQLWVNQQGE